MKNVGGLTDRQSQVLHWLAEGKTMKDVGIILKIRPRTVAFHKYRIKKVLDARNDVDLIKFAVRNHLTPP
jgi:DNA-binding CsgD family transcriptional regulator